MFADYDHGFFSVVLLNFHVSLLDVTISPSGKMPLVRDNFSMRMATEFELRAEMNLEGQLGY